MCQVRIGLHNMRICPLLVVTDFGGRSVVVGRY